MIKTEKLSKSFDALKAVDKVSLTIQDNSIFGLAGTNGAGKSTLLRMLAGVLLPDRGRILIDEEDVYENPKIKQEIFFCRIQHIFTKMLLWRIWPGIMLFFIPNMTGSGLRSWLRKWDWIESGKSVPFPKE